jgi:iron(III) transport system substrate-binding protein
MLRALLRSSLVATVLVLNPQAFAAEVNIYSHRHYDTDRELYSKFEQQSGIKVNVVHAKAEELLARLKLEGERSPADLFITADVGNLHEAKAAGALQAIDSEIINSIVPEHLRDVDGQWYGLTKRARVIIYNKASVDPSQLSTYEAMGKAEFPYTIATRTSANAYNKSLLASLIAHNGKEAALEWAQGMVKNFARSPRGNDRDQIRAAAGGIAQVAIANTYYLGIFVHSQDPADQEIAKQVGVFFPNQDDRGTHINISGVGVTKSAKNVDNAIKLIEFLLSAEAQAAFANANFEYPINSEVEVHETVKSWGEFKEDSLPLNKIGEYQIEAVEVFQEAGWN